jgi:hypothetical protein
VSETSPIIAPVRRVFRGLWLAPLVLIISGGCATATGGAPQASPGPERPAPASAMEGGDVLPVRYEASTGRVFLTIPRLGEDLLYLNTLATGLGTAGLDRGQLGSSAVVRFERRGARIHLISRNTLHRAEGADPDGSIAVEESFPTSVLASFAIQSESGGAVVIDATDYFLTDVYDVVGRVRSARLGNLRVDASRSFIDPDGTRSFPMNAEIRAAITYVTDDPSTELRRHAPDGRAITMRQQHSFVRLPEPPLAMREFDPRSGMFTLSYFDFSQPFDSDYRRRAVSRWRLEPTDTAAYLRGERVEPVRPIVYYLDRGIPEPYRSAFMEGGNWWNEIFEAAGWRNAFRVELLPEGVDPMDARYPAIYWVHRQQRGPSVGPSYRDPRTGEILTTVVRMDSYRSLVDHDIYMGLVPAAGPGGLQMTAEEFSMARRRQHTAHEIGHTLGIAHNFIAAAQGRSSVMDYPYPLIDLNAEGGIDISRAYRSTGGAHDTLAIRYAYTWYPDAASEAAGLRAIVRDAEARGLAFITGGHASAQGSYPEATQWVEGSDMVGALTRTMRVRRTLLERFDARAAQPGEPLAVLNRRFAHVYLHHRYALEGAVKMVGGMRFGYAMAGESTAAPEIVSPVEQRRALALVLSALTPGELRVPEPVAGLIPPVPHGYDGDLTAIPSPAGAAFDPLAPAHSLAAEVVGNLLHPERAARVVSFHARDRANPSLEEVIDALVAATWGAPAGAGGDAQDAALRRAASRAVLDGMLDLAGSPRATAEVRAVVEHRLTLLRQRVGGAASGAEAAHRATAVRDIDRYLAGEDEPDARPRPAPIPLPWP